MLFNSVTFTFCFLPVALIGLFILGSLHRYLAIVWLAAVSLVFYGWDDPWRLTPLILASVCWNFLVGRSLARQKSGWLLFAGVAVDLLALAYFKYASLIVDTAGLLSGSQLWRLDIALPIGISFYTFTQIAFLVDVYRREAHEYEPLKYLLFVTYFPHLIAGPILHHKEVMPQFDLLPPLRLDRMINGVSWFAVGLFKKVMLADSIAAYVAPAFKAAASGDAVGFADSWIGALSYTLQIYFDFSGYSDMAIGLALMMGVTFPLNFNSPYKAHSLIDFWRRWHMTLSRFLRDYLYISLGGNRHGAAIRYVNLMTTMVLGGLWHGASWNFALWGAIHGLGLVVNHLWRDLSVRTRLAMPASIAWAITFIVVVLAWVPFRAETFDASLLFWKSMMGLDGLSGPTTSAYAPALVWIGALSAVALFAPNTQQFLAMTLSAPQPAVAAQWRPSAVWAIAMGCMFGMAVAGMMTKPSAFLYLQILRLL